MNNGHSNGGPDSNALRRAFGVLRKEVHRMERKSRKLRRQGFQKSPRRYCAVCGTTFDEAIVDPQSQITAALCSKCKAVLAQGYTACVTADRFAFIKSEHLKTTGMSGKVIPVSNETLDEIQKRHAPDQKPPESP